MIAAAPPLNLGRRGLPDAARHWRSRVSGRDGVVALACLLIFAKDWFISDYGLHTEVAGIALLMMCALYVATARGAKSGTGVAPLFIALTLTFCWLGSLAWNGALNSSSYYASFFVAMLIGAIRPRHFMLSMTVLMTINTGIQLVEAATGQFLFVYVDDEFEYDEKMLSLNDGALRVKGMFGSPLNAISVVMSLALLRPRSYYLWALLCVASALGQGRLGLGVGIVGTVVLALSSGGASTSRRMLHALAALLGLSSIIVVFAFFGTDDSIQRMLEAASSDNSQNVSRLLYWGQSINEIIGYDALSHLFGRFGYIKALQGGTESDWLRLWLDNGIVCMLAYLVPLISGLAVAVRARRWPEAYAFTMLAFVMAVYPHAQSLPNGILVWVMLLNLGDRSRGITTGAAK